MQILLEYKTKTTRTWTYIIFFHREHLKIRPTVPRYRASSNNTMVSPSAHWNEAQTPIDPSQWFRLICLETLYVSHERGWSTTKPCQFRPRGQLHGLLWHFIRCITQNST